MDLPSGDIAMATDEKRLRKISSFFNLCMHNPQCRTDLWAAVPTLISLLVALIVGTLAKVMLGVGPAHALLWFTLLAIAAYALFANKIEIFKGPGFEARLAAVGIRPVGLEKMPATISMSEFVAVNVDDIEQLRQSHYGLGDNRPTVLSCTLNPDAHYSADNLAMAVSLLARYPGLKIFVLQYNDGRVLGFMPFQSMQGVVAFPNPILRLWLVESINNGNIAEITRFPGMVTTMVTDETTTLATLEKMTKENLDTTIVLDVGGKLKSVISRQQLLSEIVLTLAG
jgi:hypothetical protein